MTGTCPPPPTSDPHHHSQESYSQECSIYAMMELIWHLCEVLFIEVLPAGCLVQQLLEWVRWHAGQEDELLSGLLTVPQPEDHREYWRAVYRLVLSGRMKEARDLLSHHSFSHTMPDVSTSYGTWYTSMLRLELPLPQMFSTIDELLRKVPVLYPTASLTRAELHRQWQEWRGECMRRRDGGDFMTVQELQLLCRVSGTTTFNFTDSFCWSYWLHFV